MTDQAAPPFYNEAGEQIGWLRAIDDHLVVLSLDGQAILAGTTPDGEVVDGSYFQWNDEPDAYAEELLARVAEVEQQLAALDYEPEYEEYEEDEALTDEELADLEWMERFRSELEGYQREQGRPPTDRELNDLMTEHYAQWQVDPESTTIWRAALEVREPDLNTHQGRTDHGVELLEDHDRARRGVEYDPRGERAATSYNMDTPEGRANFAVDRMNGFIDAEGQSIDAVLAGDAE